MLNEVRSVWEDGNQNYLRLPEEDAEVDELTVFVNKFFQCVWLQEVISFLLKVKRDLGTTFQRGSTRIFGDGESETKNG